MPSISFKTKLGQLLLTTVFVVALLASDAHAAANFEQCHNEVKNLIDTDFNIIHPYLWPDTSPVLNPPDAPRPILLKVSGCEKFCGPLPDMRPLTEVLLIFTNWILPVLGLLANLPFESASKQRKRKFFGSLIAWLGSPASTLGATLWNMHVIKRCYEMAKRNLGDDQLAKDAMYVLSCINQYDYPIGDTITDRDEALYYGLRAPLSRRSGSVDKVRRNESTFMLQTLAQHLRKNRRHAVWPIVITVVLFLGAMVVSIFLAFGELGDNTTAHSLALGLFLSWLPGLLAVMIVDRNPVSPEWCLRSGVQS